MSTFKMGQLNRKYIYSISGRYKTGLVYGFALRDDGVRGVGLLLVIGYYLFPLAYCVISFYLCATAQRFQRRVALIHAALTKVTLSFIFVIWSSEDGLVTCCQPEYIMVQ